MRISDWSSDVCSSDLVEHQAAAVLRRGSRRRSAPRRFRGTLLRREFQMIQEFLRWPAVDAQLGVPLIGPDGTAGLAAEHAVRRPRIEALDRKSTRLNSSH